MQILMQFSLKALSAEQFCAANELVDGKIFVFGGQQDLPTASGVTNQLWAFDVTLKTWDPEILATFQETWNTVAAELAAEDEYFKLVWDDLQEFRAGYKVWGNSIYLPRPRD